MSPAMEVHLKLLSQLPVKTHLKPTVEPHKRSHRRMTDAQCAALRKKIRALRAKKKSATEIARIAECSIQTVYNAMRKR